MRKLLGWAALIVVALGIFGAFMTAHNKTRNGSLGTATTMSVVPAAPVQSAASSGNPANDMLLARDKAGRLKALSEAVADRCSATKVYYMGTGATGYAAGKSFWGVQCKDGRSFAVMINPDTTGSTQVLECAALEATAHQGCFVPLKQ